jgi:hypothetical protein
VEAQLSSYKRIKSELYIVIQFLKRFFFFFTFIPALSNELGKLLSDFELKNSLNCLSISVLGRLKLKKIDLKHNN